MKKIILLSFLLSMLLALTQAQDLIVHYDFNTSATKDFSGNNNDGILLDSGRRRATWGGIGSGVSGRPLDRALANTASTMAQNNTNAGGGILTPSTLDSFTSFTISMWYRTAGKQPALSATRLLSQNQGLMLAFIMPGAVTFRSQDLQVSLVESEDVSTILEKQDEWVFVAITYDASNPEKIRSAIYAGSKTDDIALVSKNISTGSSVSRNLASLCFGANPNGSRPFDGWLDDIRIYADKTGAKGALPIDRINAVRREAFADVVGN